MSEQLRRTLVVIVGPPAVGKMTVGQELGALTGLPLFHNHLSIEAVLPVFPFGSEPFGRLVAEFRRRIFEEVVGSDLPGLILTYVWAFDQPGDRRFIDETRALFGRHGVRTVFVELFADLQTRLSRNETPERLLAKPSKRDVASSRERLLANDSRYVLNSRDDFPFPEHLRIDNTDLSPRDAAQRIAAHFGLPISSEDRVRQR